LGAVLLATLSLCFIGGCGAIPAQYELPARRTLVIVDDPTMQLGDPTMERIVAEQIIADLHQTHLGKRGELILSQEPLSKLRRKLGSRYHRVPITTLGQRVGAEQVIHVHVEQLLFYRAPGLLQPTARAQVKVMDVSEGQRIFPRPQNPEAPGLGLNAHQLAITQRDPVQGDLTPENKQVLARRMAQRIGRQVARLFYRHHRDDLEQDNYNRRVPVPDNLTGDL
jgi:hypothetical protein